MIKTLEHLFYENRLKEIWIIQPREEKALGSPYSTFQRLKGDNKISGESLGKGMS